MPVRRPALLVRSVAAVRRVGACLGAGCFGYTRTASAMCIWLVAVAVLCLAGIGGLHDVQAQSARQPIACVTPQAPHASGPARDTAEAAGHARLAADTRDDVPGCVDGPAMDPGGDDGSADGDDGSSDDSASISSPDGAHGTGGLAALPASDAAQASHPAALLDARSASPRGRSMQVPQSAVHSPDLRPPIG